MEVYTRNRTCPCARCRAHYSMWPVMLIVWGALGLLDNFTRLDFGETWPVFMIVGGALWFISSSGPITDHREPAPPPLPVQPEPVVPATTPTQEEQVPHV